jgi:Family of unknown function (DUF6492)
VGLIKLKAKTVSSWAIVEGCLVLHLIDIHTCMIKISPFIQRKHHSMLRKFHLTHLKKFKPFFCRATEMNEKVSIDVVIPCVEKDILILPLVIESARLYVMHPIGIFFVIGPNNDQIKEVCARHGCQFLDENNVLPIQRGSVKYVANGIDRSGWIFQQLIKLNADIICNSKYCLVMDADTVFVKHQSFVHQGKVTFNCSDEYHSPYFKTYSKLTGYQPGIPLSFISHHMMFDREKLAALKSHIKDKSGKEWYCAIIAALDSQEMSSFSEYETYGNFVLKRFKESVNLEYWFNVALARKDIVENLKELEERFSRTCKSVSFHDYL